MLHLVGLSTHWNMMRGIYNFKLRNATFLSFFAAYFKRQLHLRCMLLNNGKNGTNRLCVFGQHVVFLVSVIRESNSWCTCKRIWACVITYPFLLARVNQKTKEWVHNSVLLYQTSNVFFFSYFLNCTTVLTEYWLTDGQVHRTCLNRSSRDITCALFVVSS